MLGGDKRRGLFSLCLFQEVGREERRGRRGRRKSDPTNRKQTNQPTKHRVWCDDYVGFGCCARECGGVYRSSHALLAVSGLLLQVWLVWLVWLGWLVWCKGGGVGRKVGRQ